MDLAKVVAGAVAKGGGTGTSLEIEDVFSTYLHSGDTSVTNYQQISNGIALSTEYKSVIHITGDDLTDSSDLGITVTNNSNVTTADVETKHRTTSAYFNDTTNSSLSVDIPNIGTNDFTIEAWVYFMSTSGSWHDVCGFTETVKDGSTAGMGITTDANGWLSAYNMGAGLSNIAKLSANQWYHIALTRKDGLLSLYLDGVLKGSDSTHTIEIKGNINIGAWTGIDTEKLFGYIEDFRVIPTCLYNSAFTPPTSALTTNVASGKSSDGGLVWIKARDNATYNHGLMDTERGTRYLLESNTTDAEVNWDTVVSYNADGFTLGSDSYVNNTGVSYTSWTFKNAPRFFQAIKYTGNGVAGREIAHDLGCELGFIMIKTLNTSENWFVAHRTAGTGWSTGFSINLTNAANLQGNINTSYFTDTMFNSELVREPGNGTPNDLGNEYIAYLFADDPLGPSGDGSDGLIACGSYTGNGSEDGPEIDLGWEPQYLLVKKTDTTNSWAVYDAIRGMTDSTSSYLKADTSDDEFSNTRNMLPMPSGFKVVSLDSMNNSSGGTYIYMAIRRPMKTPESSDEVFAIDTQGSTADGKAPGYRTDFPVDMALTPETAGGSFHATARLIQGKQLYTNGTNTETTNASYQFDYMNGFDTRTGTASIRLGYMWARRKGFFDVVCYTGDGIAGRTVDHNLGVVPEMLIVKDRDNAEAWYVQHADLAINGSMVLNSTAAFATTYTDLWNNTRADADDFTVGDRLFINGSGRSFIAFLFATLDGISKVGSYTGNGSSQTIDCGFAAGAKFILIKRTDASGDWYFWDSVRGIVAGNDPHLSLNTTAAEVTSDDSIDPDTTGFIVNQVAATNINVNSAEYIFYSISV